MRLLRTREGSRGLPLSDFRASVPLRRVGPEETAAERIPSILWSRRTSRASNTRSALTTRRWCSTPLKERSEEHTSELQSRLHLVCRLLLEKKKTKRNKYLNTL